MQKLTSGSFLLNSSTRNCFSLIEMHFTSEVHNPLTEEPSGITSQGWPLWLTKFLALSTRLGETI
jgi:hypothetical protein